MAALGQISTQGGGKPRVQVSGPGALVAAVPSMMGFVPTESIVCIPLEDGRVGTVIRSNLGLLADPMAVKSVVRSFAAAGDFDSLILIAVGADPVARQQALRAVSLECQATGHIVADTIHVAEIAEGKRWRNRAGNSGALPDPATTETAAAQVAAGRQVRGSRDELVAALARTGKGLDAGQRARKRDARVVVRTVVEAIDRHGAGKELSDDDIVRVGRALLQPPIRDVLIGLSTTDRAHPTQDVLAEVARRCRGAARVEALTLVGAFAYVDRNGALAGIALAAALDEDPGHSLSALLRTALSGGCDPRQVTAGLMSAVRESANQLGIAPLC